MGDGEGGAARAGGGGAGACGDGAPDEALPEPALGRSAAACGGGPGSGGDAVDPAGRRADGQPRFGQRPGLAKREFRLSIQAMLNRLPILPQVVQLLDKNSDWS